MTSTQQEGQWGGVNGRLRVEHIGIVGWAVPA